MGKVYFSNSNMLIRSMQIEDAKIIYDTYLSYGWHPSLETYENYYKEQEERKRKVFIAEYEGEVSGLCTLVLNPTEGPWSGRIKIRRVSRAYHKPILSKKLEMGFSFAP